MTVTSLETLVRGMPLTRTAVSVLPWNVAACFGHVVPTLDGRLLLCAYGARPGDTGVSALLLVSADGVRWELMSVLAPGPGGGHGGYSEATIARDGQGRLMALVRNQEPPFPLMMMVSDDEGASWSTPRETALQGHAPMLLRRRTGEVIALYRDMSQDEPGVALARYGAGRWHCLGRIADYPGNPYDGGYGDLLELPNGDLLAVYYRSEGDGSPWIEGAVVRLD